MITKIQKWGNSQGFRLPKAMMKDVDIHVGDDVDVHVIDGKIVIEPAYQFRNRYNIDDLVSGEIERDGEVDMGSARGNETW